MISWRPVGASDPPPAVVGRRWVSLGTHSSLVHTQRSPGIHSGTSPTGGTHIRLRKPIPCRLARAEPGNGWPTLIFGKCILFPPIRVILMFMQRSLESRTIFGRMLRHRRRMTVCLPVPPLSSPYGTIVKELPESPATGGGPVLRIHCAAAFVPGSVSMPPTAMPPPQRLEKPSPRGGQ